MRVPQLPPGAADVPIIGQGKKDPNAPKYEKTTHVPDPAFGQVVLKLIPIETSGGGIIVPGAIPGDEANERPHVAEVVKTSAEYIMGVHKLPTPVAPGDRVILRSLQDGASHVTDMPDKHVCTSLANIAAVHKAGVLNPHVIAMPPIETPPSNDNEPQEAEEAS